jgi:serine phosphatase RsbU (regulator of sigma subunit)
VTAPSTAGDLRELQAQLLALDPQVDFEAFLLAAADRILAATGAVACGLSRRFAGAARDYSLLVPREGEPRRRVLSLDHDRRYERLPVPHEGKELNAFNNNSLSDMASEIGLAVRRVLVVPVIFRGKPVVDVELADADLDRVPNAGVLKPILAEAAVIFELAVVQERVRRERLEARLLLEVGRELGRTLDLRELLTSILDLLHQLVPFDAAAIYVLGGDGLAAVHHSLRGYDKEQEFFVRLKLDQGIVGSAARTGEGEIVEDVTRDPRYLVARPETRSEMVVPLKSGGRVTGVFNLESDTVEAYNPHDLELLETFAGHAAAAIERARLLDQEQSQRRIEQELAIARRIQKSFLPQSELLRDEGIVGRTLFSEAVSGDYYDFVERENGSLAVTVADVSGKGFPAALIMSTLRAAFRLEAEHDEGPDIVCRNLNGFLVGSLRETEFVTGVFGFLDRDRRRFWYTNAGHNPPLLLRADGSVSWLETGGLVLGAFPGLTYEAATVDLHPGDVLVLYTDGVTEAHAGDHADFGVERLLATVRAHAGGGPEAVCDAVVRVVRSFVGGGPLPDDLTLVVLRGGGRNP